MRFREPLNDILGQQAKVKILRLLVLKGVELSGRQIAEEAGLSHTGIHNALKDLVAVRVLREREAGRALLFKLNRDNQLVREILIPLFKKEAALLPLALASLLEKLPVPIISLILYGSVIQKRETSQSDIDLLVVVSPASREKAEAAFDKICADFLSRYDRTLSPCFMTPQELQNKYRQRLPFLVEVVKTGVVIKGALISELLRHGR